MADNVVPIRRTPDSEERCVMCDGHCRYVMIGQHGEEIVDPCDACGGTGRKNPEVR